MPKILFIVDHRLNRSPSQRYRFEQYLSYFKEQGFDWVLSEIINAKDDKIFYQQKKYLAKAWVILKSIFVRFKDLKRAKQFDVIFIQREALLIGSSFFEKQFYKRHHHIIFDFDDSIWLLDTSPGNKKFEFLKNPQKTKINIQHAHIVIAGNSYLANYAKQFHQRVIVIPTTVDTQFHFPIRKVTVDDYKREGKIIIGWSGSISTIKHFEMAIPALLEVDKKYPNQLEFHVMGQGNYSHPQLQVVSKNWNPKTENADLNAFDIGIMPLPDNEWVKGKCGLKGITYMACGTPTIMSAVGVNTQIIQHGENGFLAHTHEEWVRYLSQLIEDVELRHRLGLAGRQTVVEKYSVNANKHHYLEVLKSLI